MTLQTQKLIRRWAESEAQHLAENWSGSAILAIEGEHGAYRIAVLDENGIEKSSFRGLSRGAATRIVTALERELPRVGIIIAARMCAWATENDSLLLESFAPTKKKKKMIFVNIPKSNLFEESFC